MRVHCAVASSSYKSEIISSKVTKKYYKVKESLWKGRGSWGELSVSVRALGLGKNMSLGPCLWSTRRRGGHTHTHEYKSLGNPMSYPSGFQPGAASWDVTGHWQCLVTFLLFALGWGQPVSLLTSNWQQPRMLIRHSTPRALAAGLSGPGTRMRNPESWTIDFQRRCG